MDNIIEINKKFSTTRNVLNANPKDVENSIKKSENYEASHETLLFLNDNKSRKGEGGLRKKDYFKKSLDKKPLITFVTVVFNGENFIEDTILSIINQSYDNVEYIIIDGGSTDRTLDIIREYEHAIDYWVSEDDFGIYDAMNKGIATSTGDWINFMNAGDFLINDVLSQIDFNHNLACIYGLSKLKNSNKITKSYYPNHQAMFFSNTFAKSNKYNSSFYTAADLEIKLKVFKFEKYLSIDNIIVEYSDPGLSVDRSSSQKVYNVLAENVYVRIKYLGVFSAIIFSCYFLLRNSLWILKK